MLSPLRAPAPRLVKIFSHLLPEKNVFPFAKVYLRTVHLFSQPGQMVSSVVHEAGCARAERRTGCVARGNGGTAKNGCVTLTGDSPVWVEWHGRLARES